MGKQNDKKVIREARSLLISALSNLLESERERKNPYKSKPGHKPRRTFCNKVGLSQPTVVMIETGRFTDLRFEQIRPYLAALKGRDDRTFYENFKKVYEGLKAIDFVLRNL
ncbi:MAG: hypothetical protein EG824_13730 [Deltaproteobacteria bacterium]|nr:hypothetical protein [Deltaproteobacteria bacterium]